MTAKDERKLCGKGWARVIREDGKPKVWKFGNSPELWTLEEALERLERGWAL